MKFAVASSVLFIPVRFSPAYAQDTVACDLVDSGVATTILDSAVTRHTPNRTTQKVDGDSKVSDCLFFAGRDRLHVRLVELPSSKEADRRLASATTSSEFGKYTRESGVGDAASWWSDGATAHGLSARKGRWILILDTRWQRTNSSATLRGRIKSAAVAALNKL